MRVYGDGEEIRALEGVDLRIKHGELLAILGLSGGVKSTLLNVLGALDKPTRWSVLLVARI
jgi:ABC-type lipoprotein export system ATPase subunit